MLAELGLVAAAMWSDDEVAGHRGCCGGSEFGAHDVGRLISKHQRKGARGGI